MAVTQDVHIIPFYQYVTGTTTTTFLTTQMVGAQHCVYNSTATTPGSIATPTAAALFTASPWAWIGFQWIWRVINSSSAANTMTLTFGNNVTQSGTTTYTVAEFAYREFLCTFGGSIASPTVTMQNVAAGAAATN